MGNGFTIDFINFLIDNGDSRLNLSKINVSNLFTNGELVPWPGNDKPGFLSYKYCPNLWTLGARPNMNNESSIALIEEIITCANILNSTINQSKQSESIYVKAYKELVTYLKALFIYYNSLIDVPNINITDWEWAKFFKAIYQNIEIEKIYVVTFNYDIFIERIFKKLGLDYSISNFDSNSNKITIFKPHGSISFAYKYEKVKDVFTIGYDLDSNDGDISDFGLRYDDLNALHTINAIIPPAGDSHRLNFKWAKSIKDEAKHVATKLTEDDNLIIFGISYWHVDRLEIDSILTSINPNLKDVIVVNPNPPKVFNAIITTLFENVTFFKNSEPLTKIVLK